MADQQALDKVVSHLNGDSSESLAEVLVESGAVSAGDKIALEHLLERHLAKHGDDPQASISSLVSFSTPVESPASLADTITFVPAANAAHHPPRLFGDYELLGEIARGGMGVVYKARQAKLNRFVALKMIRSGELADDEQVQRFYAEAESAAKLDHPGIVPVYEVGQANGQHFFSMALVVGTSLNEQVKNDGPLPPKEAARLLKLVVEAVEYAHGKGIIHRDIKPQNILLDEAGQPRLTDFGLAKQVLGQSELTATGQVMGTPSYMPPEQASGKLDEIGTASDVYSLGATLYFVLTGRPPFQTASMAETIRQVLDVQPVPLRRLNPEIPRDLETICLKCLRKESVKRYGTAAELAADLGNWLENRPIVARPVGRAEKAWLWCKRRPTLVLMSLLLVVLSVVGTVAGTLISLERQNTTRIEGLVGRLVSAEPNQLSEIVKELDANPSKADAFLSPLLSSNASTPGEKRSQLHARLARVSRDPSLIEPLVEELLTGKVSYVLPIRQQLRPSAAQLTEQFRVLLRDEKVDAERRFRAALALADYVPDTEAAAWIDQDLKFVAQQLVSANAEFQPPLRDALRPIRARLLADLERIFADPTATDAQRLGAANAIVDYASTDIGKLAKLLTFATPEQYKVLYPIVAASPTPGALEDLGKIAATLPPADLGSVKRVAFGQRRANAAVTLLRLGEREKVLPVFEMTDDPEALTQFIFRYRERGVGVDSLLDCLRIVSDAPQDRHPKNTRYALLLALGELKLEEIPAARREALLKQLADWYRQDPSSGVHGAAGWLLRQWGQTDIARQVDQTPVPYAAGREWFTLAIQVTAKSKSVLGGLPEHTTKQTFYYTFIVFPPGDYTIGSVVDEPERTLREASEQRHGAKLTRPFALLDREVTMAELIAFSPQHYSGYMQQFKARPEVAGFAADWYDSVGFCRWLGQQSGLPEGDQPYASPESLDKETYPREPNPAANWAPRDWPVELGRRGFRLPTEAECEVASRAGARTAYGYGSDVGLLGRFGWFTENSGKHVHPPRELRPSVRGLFDLHGNLLEWTHDWFDDFGSEGVTDPLVSKRGSMRVCRSGSWNHDAANGRSAIRNGGDPTNRTSSSGFRLALSLSGVTPEAGQGKGAEPAGGGTKGASAEQRPEMP